MKARFLLLLTSFTCIFLGHSLRGWSQVQALGTVIGNQTVVSIPIAPPGYPTAQALVYYPDDYFLPANANKRYPLFVFMHGSGEGSGTNITEVTNTSLPMLIKQGLKPFGIDQATGDTVKYIVVSPHCASCGSNYSYPQLQYTIPSLFTTYRVDTSCVWVGGLSAGARGTWSVVMGGAVGDTALGKRITGIMPMANGGYDNMLASMEPNLDTIAKRGLGTLYVIGDQDPGYNSIGFFAYQAVMKTFSQPGKYYDKVIVGGTHSGNVWNTPFPENAGVWSNTMNSWTQMWSMRKTGNVTATPPVPLNTAPVANAGTTQTITLPLNNATLTGSATDADGNGTISGYAWSQSSGPNTAGITTGGSSSTTVTGLIAGTYVFKLTVTDDQNATGTSTVQVVVNPAAAPANTAPVASAGTTQTITLPLNSASLTGSATDADGNGTIAGYAWTQSSGPNTAGITTAAAASTTVTGLIAGTYVFKLTVTDDQAATGTSTVQVVVNPAAAPANTAPVADAGTTQTITLPINSASLTGSGTDADGNATIAGYAWTQSSGPNTAGITTAAAASTTVTGLIAGTYVFKLTVTDDQAATGTSTVQVVVNAAALPANTAPVADAGTTQTITLPINSASLTGSGTDADGNATIAGYAWTQVSGPNTAGITTAAAASTSVTGLIAGTYVFKLTVTDDQNATGASTVQVVVNNAVTPPPTGTANVVKKVACTEYQAAWLYTDGTVRSFIFNPISGHVEFTPFIIGGRKAVDASTGFNRITILDDQGYVWLNDGGKNTATRWNTDATGAAFNGNLSIYGYFYTYLSIRNDGTIWYWGGDDYKFFGGTAVAAPVKITQPAGVQFVKLATGSSLLGLTSTGDVYQWNKGSMAFTKVTLPRPASDIGASHMNYFVAVVPDNIAASTMGYPYAWGSESKFWGGDGSSYAPSAPVSIKALWNLSVPIKKININQNTIHYIDANDDLYGIGDNPNGEIGNGEELVNHAEKYPTPYAWSWTKYEMLTGAPAIHILPGKKFKEVFSGNTFVFYKYAVDMNDSLYFWGRNKSFVGGDGVVNNQEATSPNALDILTPTMRTPLAIKPTQTAGFNFTAYTLKATPRQTIITTTAVLSATSTSSKLVTAGFPNYGYTIVKYEWTKVSGPACTISTPNALTTNVTGLTSGTYIFNIQTTDNNTGTISARDTIVVNAAAPGVPVADAGSDLTITLPTNSVTLTGTGAENGGTIVSYKWTEVSGPNTAGITTNTQASTGVTGLVQGVYVFQLLITDQAGTTATSTVQVTVKPAIVPGPPSANAGSDQTITLPTSSVTLTGSGSETNGTIVSYKWIQTSGPNTGAIAANTQASTGVSGLIAGVYTFQLTVTDNSGVTASDVVTINVKAAIVVGPPVANAGSDQSITLPTSSVTLTGSGSETNGTIASYKWTQVSGPNTGSIISTSQAQTGVSGLIQGVYVFQLTVTDAAGVTATDVTTVNVKPAVVTPGTPVVDAGINQVITLPTSNVTLTGTASETNGTIVTYEWTEISGPNTANIVSSGAIQTDVNTLIAGAYTFQLKVTDNSGVTATDIVKVTVNPAIVPGVPVVDAGANQVITVPASTVTLTGVASETNGSIVTYEWTEISGPNTAIIASSGSASTGVSGLIAGVYTFQLKVTDNSGVSAVDVVKVTVNPAAANKPPVADAGSNKVVSDITPVDLDGSASYDPDGTIVKYQWVQISGLGGVTITGATTATPTIYGLESGVYVFQLTVTDNQGATDIATVSITVSLAGYQGPVAVVGNDTTIIFPGQTTALLNGSASYDPSGTITSYEWKQLSGPSAALIGDPVSSVSGVGAMIIGDYTFELTVTDDKGASAKATMRVHVLDDLRHTEHVKIYPNPVPMGQAFTAEGTTDSASIVKFTIYDIGGRMVKQVILNSQFSDFKTSIPVAGLGRGVYVLLVQFGATHKPQTFKFVID